MQSIIVPTEQEVPHIYSIRRQIWYGGGDMHGKAACVITLVPKPQKYSWAHIKKIADVKESLQQAGLRDYIALESQAIIIVGKNCDPMQYELGGELSGLVKACEEGRQMNEHRIYIHTNGLILFNPQTYAYKCDRVYWVIEPKPTASKYQPIPIENLIHCHKILVQIEGKPNSPYRSLGFFPPERSFRRLNTNHDNVISGKLVLMPRTSGSTRELIENIDAVDNIVRSLMVASNVNSHVRLHATIQFPNMLG